MLIQTCSAQSNPTFKDDVQPLFTKYCAGCHNDADREGDFSLSSLTALQAGTSEGGVVVSGKSDRSKLIELMKAEGDSRMPPEDEPAPTADEIALIELWINQGMTAGEDTHEFAMRAPKLKPADLHHHYIGAAAVAGDVIAIGKLGRVELSDARNGKLLSTVTGLPGKVNSIRADEDGASLTVGTGIAGVGGEIVRIHLPSSEITARLRGHDDTVYCAAISPDGKWLASGGYDRKVILWDAESHTPIRELTGHNGAIYDLDFDPSSSMLATASADQTVKLWSVETGERLDTLGQPEGEMLCVRFSDDGKYVYAAGADRQIRQWKLVSRNRPRINPMLVARYAHESPVLLLEVLQDNLLTASDDHTVKLWTANDLTPLGEVSKLSDTPVALCIHRGNDERSEEPPEISVIELTGKRHQLKQETLIALIDNAKKARRGAPPRTTIANSSKSEASTEVVQTEMEPNNGFAEANRLELPSKTSGKLALTQETLAQSQDIDLFRFSAEAGETWLIEVHAANKKSKLDSLIEVLDAYGQPVVRTRMQALRETYFTFRGKDSNTSDDFRLHKWEDMELDEYLYSSGEITRLWLYPRGPDSGFKVYPGFGSRHTYFGTTAVSHALGEPAYIVRKLGPQETALPNGLPVFPIYYENDDDAQRKAGKDSRLSFTAPATGEYFIRLRDARGFEGEDFHYELVLRKPQPDFRVSVSGIELSMPRGSGREWKISVDRIDGLSGPIEVRLEGLPPNFIATNPLVIEANQLTALGTVFATQDADLPLAKKEDSKETETTASIRLIATAEHQGQRITHELEDALQVKLVDLTEVQLKLFPARDDSHELEEISIRPGQTVSAKVVVERNGTKSRIGFGKEDSGRGLPHGAYVDNIGLNGLLITEQKSEREFFITAAPKLRPGRHQFHLRSDTKGNPTSRPVWLNVLPKEER